MKTKIRIRTSLGTATRPSAEREGDARGRTASVGPVIYNYGLVRYWLEMTGFAVQTPPRSAV